MSTDRHQLRLQISRKIYGTTAGGHTSVYKSTSGYELSEKRPFQISDNPKAVDLVSTITKDTWLVKVKNPDKGANIFMSWDVSGSHQFGPLGKSKLKFMSELSELLVAACVGEGNRVAMICHTEVVEHFTSLTTNRFLLEESSGFIKEGVFKRKGTNLNASIREIMECASTSGQKPDLVFIVSDFLAQDFEKKLRALAQEVDCVALVLREPVEEKFPALSGAMAVRDLETGKIFYASGLTNLYGDLSAWFKKNQITHVFMDTSRPVLENLDRLAQVLEDKFD
ncbi:MAG: hypothetical protein HYX21_03035 [Candidatus Yanofskybacteria bacterium]|nr:hypothetical protein [Candidatus Yanofskybacteria bacterium]